MKSLRLLQVENSESDAEVILRLLREARFEVVGRRVEDAAGLRQALENATWDLIVTDYQLPRLDARGVLRLLQEKGHDIPCIVVSSQMGEDVAVEMMKCGARDYLTKNKLERLAPAVERELEEAAARRKSRRVQEELWRTEDRMALAVDATQLGTFEFHPQTGKFLFSNFARQHFGLASDVEVTYHAFLAALHPADRDGAALAIRDALRHESGGGYAHEYRTLGIDDGQERWLSSRGRVFFDPEAQPLRLLGVIQDVTERKRLEQQLLQSQRLESVARLAGSVAQEFTRLLSTINAHAHSVLAEIGPNDLHRDSLEEISKAGLQAADLTRQLVSLSRLHAAEPKIIDLNQFMSARANMLRRVVGERVELELSLESEAGAFRADLGHIEQVLLNLAVNAKDAMPAGGTLVLETSSLVVDDHLARTHLSNKPGRYVVLAVSDTGTGMSPEVKFHLFEPFYTTKEPGKGTGLGLPTVLGVVLNQSRGSILVSSEVGQGTTFRLFFPFVHSEGADGPPARIERLASRGETILLAEDEPEVRKPAREILERYGYTVLEASHGLEALGLARSHPAPIHLLLTEILMPATEGEGLAERFNAEFPRIPVLFMSGYSHETISLQNALSAYLQKPFTLVDLLTQVRDLLDGSGICLSPAPTLSRQASAAPLS